MRSDIGLPNPEPTDEHVMARLADRDDTALGVLYDRYGVLAYSLALRITADGALAEDAVQEAFLDAWQGARRFSPERGSVKTWLLSIVHHRSIDAVRRRRSTDELPDVDSPSPGLMAPDVWPEVAGRLDRAAILDALASINPAQREVLELAYFGDLSQQAIAARLGLPLGTVKGRVRLGVAALRDALLAAGTVDVHAFGRDEP